VALMYAKGTKTSVESSRAELERTLSRYGADAFSYGADGERAIVAFRVHGKHVKFELRYPPLADFRYTRTTTRTPHQQRAAREQRIRELWRALVLVVKARLESVESGIESFEQAFLPYIQLPDGQTAGEFLIPQVERAYELGDMPPLLPAASSPQLPRGDE
jgi:hypothetical protein